MKRRVSVPELVLIGERVIVTIPPRRRLHALHGRRKVRVVDDLAAVLTQAPGQHEVDLAAPILVSVLNEVRVDEVQRFQRRQVCQPAATSDQPAVNLKCVSRTPGAERYGCSVGRAAITSVACSRMPFSSSNPMTGSASSSRSMNLSRSSVLMA